MLIFEGEASVWSWCRLLGLRCAGGVQAGRPLNGPKRLSILAVGDDLLAEKTGSGWSARRCNKRETRPEEEGQGTHLHKARGGEAAQCARRMRPPIGLRDGLFLGRWVGLD